MDFFFELRNLTSNERVKLSQPSQTLGRHVDCDIVLDDDEASRQHARLEIKAGDIYLEDLGSTNGTYLNNKEVRKVSKVVGGDIITIGEQSFLVLTPDVSGNDTIFGAKVAREASSFVVDKSEPEATSMRMAYPSPPGWTSNDQHAFGDAKAADEQHLSGLLKTRNVDESTAAGALMVTNGARKHGLFVLPKQSGSGQWTIGRSEDRDITIDEITVSNGHATLSAKGDSWRIEDNQSTNGIKVNGSKTSASPLNSGDRISIGDVELLFRSF
jgi:pSer/pThr/pTyr-binding forkhead associated (FHA) protein